MGDEVEEDSTMRGCFALCLANLTALLFSTIFVWALTL